MLGRVYDDVKATRQLAYRMLLQRPGCRAPLLQQSQQRDAEEFDTHAAQKKPGDGEAVGVEGSVAVADQGGKSPPVLLFHEIHSRPGDSLRPAG